VCHHLCDRNNNRYLDKRQTLTWRIKMSSIQVTQRVNQRLQTLRKMNQVHLTYKTLCKATKAIIWTKVQNKVDSSRVFRTLNLINETSRWFIICLKTLMLLIRFRMIVRVLWRKLSHNLAGPSLTILWLRILIVINLMRIPNLFLNSRTCSIRLSILTNIKSQWFLVSTKIQKKRRNQFVAA